MENNKFIKQTQHPDYAGGVKMASVMDDIASELYMVRDDYEKLKAKNPEHELLALAGLQEDREGFEFTEEFWKKCGQENEHVIHAYMRYHSFLEKALAGTAFRFLDDSVYKQLESLKCQIRDSFKALKKLELERPFDLDTAFDRAGEKALKQVLDSVINVLFSGATTEETAEVIREQADAR